MPGNKLIVAQARWRLRDWKFLFRVLPRDRRARSHLGNVDDGLGERLRGYLWQVVPDAAGDEAVLVLAGEFLGVGAGVRMRGAVGVAFHRDGGDRDDRAGGESLFQFVVFCLARGEREPPAIIMNHDRDVIWIVEGGGAAVERGVVEAPLGRRGPPDQLGKIVPIFVVAGPPAVGGE